MTDRTDLRRRTATIGALFTGMIVAGCGSDKTTLVIANEGDASLELTQILTRACLERYWSPEEPALDPARDLPAEGVVTIPHGESRSFEIPPGCHDFQVTRGGEVARARVVLDVGESETWVPFRIDENDNWWCFTEDCK